jgi:hypothetical protein
MLTRIVAVTLPLRDKFEHGFFSGFVSSLGGSFMQTYGTSMNARAQVIMSAAIGGTAEALGKAPCQKT